MINIIVSDVEDVVGEDVVRCLSTYPTFYQKQTQGGQNGVKGSF